MAAYNYIALDKNGAEVKGIAEADTPKKIREQLRNKGLSPLEVTLVQGNKAIKKRRLFVHGKSMKAAELSLVTRQFATLLNAGLPLEEVLQGVAEQSEKGYIKSVIIGVRAKVLEGFSLATAMSEFPKAFPTLYRATVAAGEQSSHLDTVLNQLADYIEKQHKMRQKLTQALLYPALMTFVSLCIVVFLLIYVVPSMVSVFSQTKQALPWMTTSLLHISSFVQHKGFYTLLIIITGILTFAQMLKRPSVKFAFHHLLLRIPLLGNALKTINTARFTRTFGILFSAGIPVIEAMHVSSELITLLPIQNAVNTAKDQVREGANIYLALQQTKYFPPMSIHLIASGEKSGQLERMLQRVADYQDHNVTVLLENVLTLFEPLLILLMGTIVLFIVLAVLLPIFNMEQLT